MFHLLCSEAVATGLPSSLAPDVQQLKVPTVQRGGQVAVGLELTVFRAQSTTKCLAFSVPHNRDADPSNHILLF